MPTNNLYCIVGPSGAGKTTLMEDLKTLGYREAISHTTRDQRDGEPDDAYHFVDSTSFMELVAGQELVDYTRYAGQLYGVSNTELELSDFAIVEPKGAGHIKKSYSSHVSGLFGIEVFG